MTTELIDNNVQQKDLTINLQINSTAGIDYSASAFGNVLDNLKQLQNNIREAEKSVNNNVKNKSKNNSNNNINKKTTTKNIVKNKSVKISDNKTATVEKQVKTTNYTSQNNDISEKVSVNAKDKNIINNINDNKINDKVNDKVNNEELSQENDNQIQENSNLIPIVNIIPECLENITTNVENIVENTEININQIDTEKLSLNSKIDYVPENVVTENTDNTEISVDLPDEQNITDNNKISENLSVNNSNNELKINENTDENNAKIEITEGLEEKIKVSVFNTETKTILKNVEENNSEIPQNNITENVSKTETNDAIAADINSKDLKGTEKLQQNNETKINYKDVEQIKIENNEDNDNPKSLDNETNEDLNEINPNSEDIMTEDLSETILKAQITKNSNVTASKENKIDIKTVFQSQVEDTSETDDNQTFLNNSDNTADDTDNNNMMQNFEGLKSAKTTNSSSNNFSNINAINNITFGKAISQSEIINNKSVNASDVINQVTTKFTQLKDTTTSKINMILNPESLGKVSVELISRPDGVIAKMIAQTPQAKEILDKHLDTLKNSLASQGVNVNEISVKIIEKAQNGGLNLNYEQQSDLTQNKNSSKNKETDNKIGYKRFSQENEEEDFQEESAEKNYILSEAEKLYKQHNGSINITI